ncbi:MAG: hypothetical protein GY757_25135 [bacterium]|nr:hypothetical protein [bacterium]
MNDTGHRLKTLRKDSGLTLDGFASQIHDIHAGLFDPEYVYAILKTWETDNTPPDNDVKAVIFETYSSIFRVNVDWVQTGKGRKNKGFRCVSYLKKYTIAGSVRRFLQFLQDTALKIIVKKIGTHDLSPYAFPKTIIAKIPPLKDYREMREHILDPERGEFLDIALDIIKGCKRDPEICKAVYWAYCNHYIYMSISS